MKKYIIPTTKAINLTPESLIAVSGGGLEDGDNVGNTPVGGGTDNDFTRGQNSLWDSWK